MNIAGSNTLACHQSDVGHLRLINIYPLPHMPVVKDWWPI